MRLAFNRFAGDKEGTLIHDSEGTFIKLPSFSSILREAWASKWLEIDRCKADAASSVSGKREAEPGKSKSEGQRTESGTTKILAPLLYRKVLKGRPIMCTSPQSASSISPPASPNIAQTNLWAERTYQLLTIAAVLWILGSLWLFR